MNVHGGIPANQLGCIKPCKQDCFINRIMFIFFEDFPCRLGSYLEPVESLAHRDLVLPRSLPGSVKSSKISMDFSGSYSDPQNFTLWSNGGWKWLPAVDMARSVIDSNTMSSKLTWIYSPTSNSLHQDDIAFLGSEIST